MSTRRLISAAIGLTLILSAKASGGPGIRTPELGLVRDGSGVLRPLAGIGGNFLLGDPVMTGVRALAAGENQAIAVVGERLVVIRNGAVGPEMDAPTGIALLGLDERGEGAVAVFPDAATVALAGSAGWHKIPFEPPEGKIVAVASAARGAVLVLAVIGPDGLRLVRRLAARRLTLGEEWVAPGAAAACLLPERRLLYTDRGRLVLREPGGSEQWAPFSGEVEAMEPLGDEWVHIRTPGRPGFVVRVDGGHLDVYRLPEGRR